jgi:mRNA interferase MazF
MAAPGDVVLAPFPGVQGVKDRPVLVVSSLLYHSIRPDVVLALLTTNVAAAVLPTDYVLVDWAAAGLNRPTAFRSFFATIQRANVIGQLGVLSARDWAEVQARLRLALAV